MEENTQYQINTKAFNALKVTLFKGICAKKGIPIESEQLPRELMPAGIPRMMQDFYAAFAPVHIDLKPLKIKFLLYKDAFAYIQMTNSPSFIPIAVYNDNQYIYMDKHFNGTWDERIKMDMQNGKALILGENIFDFLIHLANQ